MLRARLLGALEVELNGAVIDSPASQRPWAMFAYLALAAYLGWLLCRASLSGWLAASEPDISEGERR